MSTEKLPPEGPKSWVLRTIDEIKGSRLTTRAIGGVVVALTSLGIGSGLSEAAKDFDASHRETSCHTFSAVIEGKFDGEMLYVGLDNDSMDRIQRFLEWQPGGYQAEQISANSLGLAYNSDTGTVAPGEIDVQVCVTDAPLSGSDISVSRVESTDPKRMSGPLA